MLIPPDGLPEDVLVAELARSWGVTVASMIYRPVGFGSHHWEVTDSSGTRWFVTADELEKKRHSRSEPLSTAFGRLRASLAAARDLQDCGRTFVLAPVPALDGEPVARAGERFGIALYPFVDGQSFEWGEFSDPEQRRGMLELVIGVHTAPGTAAWHAMSDDFAVPHRDELEAVLDPGADVPDCGPYARLVALLAAEHATAIRRLLARYDALVAQARSRPPRTVLTHGEPHPGNTMLTSAGWLLIDWDTALIAPPERDLWTLDPGDGTVLAAYAEATGMTPQPSMLELYRIRWGLADIAVDVSRFRRPHSGSAEDDKSWQILSTLIASV